MSINAHTQTETNLYKNTDKDRMNQWVDSVFNELTLDEKIGQLFMPIVESTASWQNRISSYIDKQKIGGVLFSKGTLKQQAEMTNYIQSISKVPLFIALDGEWGLSMRLTDAQKYPRNQIIGAISNEEMIKLYGKELARQCKEMGIHINFAPSIDVHSNPKNPVIGTRSFGENTETVAWQGIAYAKGMESNGVLAVAKHFPGHGDTSTDSHLTLPVINHGIDRLNSVELAPFKQYIDSGLSGMMIGHLDVPALKTNGVPSSLSKNIGEKLLKEEMGFTGITFTDGMAMKGVSTQKDMSVRALLAGNDVILGVINQPQEFNNIKNAVAQGVISEELIDSKVKKILSYKYILDVHKFKPINTATISNRVNSPESEWIQRKLYDNIVTLLKNNDSIVPIKELDKNKIASVAIGSESKTPFQNWLSRYTEVNLFNTSNYNGLNSIINKTKDYDLLIVSLHSPKMVDNAALQQLLSSNPKTILVVFDSPYSLDNLKVSTGVSSSLVVGYDNSNYAQASAAQAIFGGISFSGKLPVSAGKYSVNSGIATNKIRLSYSYAEEVGIPTSKFDHIENIAIEGIRQKAYPGCYVMVVKDGVVIYDKSFGNLDYSSSSKVTENTVYDLASITKVAATLPAFMKLYDEKKIKLQDNFAKYIPKTKGTNKANITMREALLHESGVVSYIPYYVSAIDPNSFTGKLFGKRSQIFNANYAGAWGRTDYKFDKEMIADKKNEKYYMPVAKNIYASDAMHDKLLQDIIDTPLSPKRYRYSCLNFMLIKESIDNITGTDLDNYLQKNFYKKLGASTTTFLPLNHMSENIIAPTENDPFFRKQQIRGYVHDEGAALFGGISGNAGLFSSANDLAKLLQMWMNGGEYGGERYLSEETVTLFTKTSSNKSRRGLGFDKPDLRNNNLSPTSPLAPISVYGHTGFTGTSFWSDPDNNLIYIFLSNRVYPSRSPNRLSTLNIRERIQDEIYKAIVTDKKN